MGSHGGFELVPVGDLFMIDRYREGLDREQTTRSECTENRGWFIPAAKFQIPKRTRVASPVPAATLSQPSSDLSLAVQSPASGTGHKRDRDKRLLGVCCRGFSDKPPDAVGHEAGHAFQPDFFSSLALRPTAAWAHLFPCIGLHAWIVTARHVAGRQKAPFPVNGGEAPATWSCEGSASPPSTAGYEVQSLLESSVPFFCISGCMLSIASPLFPSRLASNHRIFLTNCE